MRTTFQTLAVAALAAALLACGGDSGGGSADPCAGAAAPCVAFRSGAAEATIANAFASAQPGTTLAFGAGTFRFTNSLQVGADRVTVKGAGREATTLDFGGTVGPEGIGAAGVSGLTVADLGVVDVAGNGIKVTNVDGATFRNVKTWWRSADLSTHGGYGIYPVLSKNVLIEGCFASGASDTGLYVGQSQTIVVRGNEATGNVAGIEIENSVDADVHDNDVHGNSGGILVFNLPLPVKPEANRVRVFDNRVTTNDLDNFADPAGVVALVPKGTGVIVMANRDVEIFGNTITGNGTTAVAIASYLITGNAPPAGYDPLPARVYVHDNTFDGNGTAPDGRTDGLGFLLDILMGADPIPNQVWDGFVPDGTDAAANPLRICLGAAPTSVLNLNGSKDSSAWSQRSTDPAPFGCELPALPEVTLP